MREFFNKSKIFILLIIVLLIIILFLLEKYILSIILCSCIFLFIFLNSKKIDKNEKIIFKSDSKNEKINNIIAIKDNRVVKDIDKINIFKKNDIKEEKKEEKNTINEKPIIEISKDNKKEGIKKITEIKEKEVIEKKKEQVPIIKDREIIKEKVIEKEKKIPNSDKKENITEPKKEIAISKEIKEVKSVESVVKVENKNNNNQVTKSNDNDKNNKIVSKTKKEEIKKEKDNLKVISKVIALPLIIPKIINQKKLKRMEEKKKEEIKEYPTFISATPKKENIIDKIKIRLNNINFFKKDKYKLKRNNNENKIIKPIKKQEKPSISFNYYLILANVYHSFKDYNSELNILNEAIKKANEKGIDLIRFKERKEKLLLYLNKLKQEEKNKKLKKVLKQD